MNTTAYSPPSDPTAVFGRRTVAFIIDVVIGLAIAIAVFAAVAESKDFGSSERAEEVCDDFDDTTNNVCIPVNSTVILAEEDDVAVIGLSLLGWGVVAMLVIPTITGGSVGKLMVGLRVVDKNTFAKAGFGKHLVRWLLWIVDSAPWFCGVPLVGLITGLSSKGHRRVGDMAAGTLVVDKTMVDNPVAVAGANDLAGTFAPPAPPAGAPLTPPPPSGPPVSPPAPSTAATDTVAPPEAAPAPYAAPTAPPVDEAPDPTAAGDFGPEPFAPILHPPAPQPAPPEPEPPAPAPAAPAPAPPEPEPPAPAPPAPEPPAPEPPAPAPPAPAPAPPAPAPAPPRPGIDVPQWDPARNTYIQWDPELEEWMEWSESARRWIPISR